MTSIGPFAVSIVTTFFSPPAIGWGPAFGQLAPPAACDGGAVTAGRDDTTGL